MPVRGWRSLVSVPLPDRKPFWKLRQWLGDHIPIRQRLALWYVTLVGATLFVFSAIVYTAAQTQLQGSVNNDLQNRAVAIATALQHVAETANGSAPFGPTSSTPTATARVTPTPSTASSPSPTGANSTPTPVPTPDPNTAAKIQNTLQIQVPELLGRLDFNFEVLGLDGKPQYLTPALTGTGLPLDQAAIRAGLQGAPSSYTMRGTSSLLEIYVEPIALPAPTPTTGNTTSSNASGGTPATPTATATTAPPHVVGLVLVAKPLDDINGTLATLLRLLLIGDCIAVIFAYIGGWLIAASGLRPIADVTRAARTIAANAHSSGLGTRVAYRGVQDDVGALVMTFNEMLAAIERVSTAQRRFVADASHELRAPLMTIKGSLELLRRAPDLPEEERRAMIQDAFAEAERMAVLVSDLLLLARVDAISGGSYGLHESWLDDQLRSRREPVEIDQLVMAIFRQGRSQLRAKRKDLHITITNLEPITVMGDPGQLRQAALILLDNAIKYTPAGGKIRISAARNGDRAALSITDTGIGIEPEDRAHIFERFYRADRARERDEQGSGLGLSIAKWIAEAHQGDISVYSQPGQGSTFTLLLPALPGGERAEDTRPSGSTRVAKSGTSGGPIQAIQPLARLARSVSRPRSAHSRTERDPRRSDKSASAARMPKPKRGSR
jgi:signal transduction histidine kinase